MYNLKNKALTFIVLLTIMLISFRSIAQFKTPGLIRYGGDFEIKVKDMETEDVSYNYDGVTYNFIRYSGKYTITKASKVQIGFTYSALKNTDKDPFSRRTLSINISHKEGWGNTVTYFYDTNIFEYEGKENKDEYVKTFKNPNPDKEAESIIVAAILIYANKTYK